MNLNHLKNFAQAARRKLMAEVAARLDYLLGHDDAYIRANEAHIEEIRRQLDRKGREQLLEEVAYTWFNRIVALRYMDLCGYNKARIVSPQAGQVQPELLYQIKQGRTPKQLQSLQETFNAYLEGTIRTDQPDREIYTAALLGMCNAYTEMLPFLFRRVDDYMAVLLPTDLLSENSIIADVQEAIGEGEVEDVEVIGWLYQFYISEKKDQVFARPKGEKIKKEDIPAATQLFTPHWIVRYMVENSLGRLWRNNFPDTRVSEQMDYYIEGDPEPDYLEISGPEEITLLDPACGSGHILTYAFDLLYAMYEESGYTPSEIPSLILRNNLYGIDIDTRAAELAAFALTMKARGKDRFFFKRGVEPNVIAMEDVTVDLREADIRMSPQLQEAFGYLGEATNFGSLIPVPADVQGEIEDLLAQLDAKGDADLFADQAVAQVHSGVRQLGYLARRYDCVVTNPPYVNRTNMDDKVKDFLKVIYDDSSTDVFSAFIVAGLRSVLNGGYVAAMSPFVWMFISSFEKFRIAVLRNSWIQSLVQLEYSGFEGATVPVCTFNLRRGFGGLQSSTFIRLSDFRGPALQGPKTREAVADRNTSFRYQRVQSVFFEIPGTPIVYWLPSYSFFQRDTIRRSYVSGGRLKTHGNEKYIRFFWEVGSDNVDGRWRFVANGGGFRKWYGLTDYVVDYEESAYRFYESKGGLPSPRWQAEGLTWGMITSSISSFRIKPLGHLYTSGSPTLFPMCLTLMAYLNSKVGRLLVGIVAPTLNASVGEILKLPDPGYNQAAEKNASDSVDIARKDWNSRETSSGFLGSPLMRNPESPPGNQNARDDSRAIVSLRRHSTTSSIATAFSDYVDSWSYRFREMHGRETENNRIFIDLYGLQDELSPDVPYTEVTILQDELDKDARERGEVVFNKKEVLRQFVSYGVGCIFGRYSLDEDGLILANAGDDLGAYLARIPEPRLRPDESGILPITEDDAFPDDLPSQFRDFLRAAFGTERYDENLQFLEEGLGKDLRRYFLKEFYKDHVKRYKKRPIYWLITSPKGSLQGLIYLHRYNRDTVNRFLNDYLRPYQRKLEARKRTAEQSVNTGGVSGSERTRARKEIDQISTALEELSLWERDVVRPLAEQRIELDLDDGVKVNYGKLGAILETVKGLNG